MKKIFLILAIIAFPLQTFADYTSSDVVLNCTILQNNTWLPLYFDINNGWYIYLDTGLTYTFSQPFVWNYQIRFFGNTGNYFFSEYLDCVAPPSPPAPPTATRLTAPQGVEVASNVTTIWFSLVDIMVLLAPIILLIGSLFWVYNLIRRSLNISQWKK